MRWQRVFKLAIIGSLMSPATQILVDALQDLNLVNTATISGANKIEVMTLGSLGSYIDRVQYYAETHLLGILISEASAATGTAADYFISEAPKPQNYR
jgi:hypothetical protein